MLQYAIAMAIPDFSDSDERLLAASRAGDVGAFGQLIERYHNLVTAVAYSRTGDRTTSEDIAQDTFLAAWRGLGELRDATKLRGWLAGIARNLAGKTLRARRRVHVDIEEVAVAADTRGPLDTMLTAEREAIAWAALEQVPLTYREPLVLFYREQQSIKDVARGLGVSEDAAKQRLSRARQAVKHNLEVVEQTLTAGRTRKAAAAAVLTAIMAAQRTPAAAATLATRPVRRTTIAASVAAVIALGTAGVVVTRRSTTPAAPAQQAAAVVLAELRRARSLAPPQVASCTLRGTVRASAGAVAGALVAVLLERSDAAALDPIFVETDAQGAWQTAPLMAGRYAVSISAPGLIARTAAVTCDATTGSHVLELNEGGAVISGEISDVGGGGVGGATLWLTDPAEPRRLFVTRAAGDGRYELRVERGSYMAIAHHPDYSLEVRPVTLGSAAREDIALVPGGSIEGTIVDGNGAAVAGAAVTSLPSVSDDAPARWQVAATYTSLLPAFTDSAGQFRLRSLPPGRIEVFARSANAAGTAPAVQLTLGEQKAGVVVTLAEARTVAGFAVAAGQRTGLANVQMFAVRERSPVSAPVRSQTDASGYFALAGLQPGSYRIAGVAPGYVPYTARITVGDDDPAELLVTFDEGAALRGVVDPATTHVKLVARERSDVDAQLRATLVRGELDGQGNVTFHGVAPGDYVVEATSFDLRGEYALHVDTADVAGWRVAMSPRPALVGTVVDDGGAKVPDVLVIAKPTRRTPLAPAHTLARTDAQGEFAITNVTPGDYRVQVFDARGQLPWPGTRAFAAKHVEVPRTGAVTEHLVVASSTTLITGRVLDERGRPVADAWIEVRAKQAGRAPAVIPPAPIVADANGQFVVNGLHGSDFLVDATSPDGTRRAVTATAPGGDVVLKLRAATKLAAQVRCGEQPAATFAAKLVDTVTDRVQRVSGTSGALAVTTLPGDYELTVTSDCGYWKQAVRADGRPMQLVLTPWSTIKARIVDEDGTPWANADVLVHEAIEITPIRTAADGTLTIDRAAAGRTEILVVPPGDVRRSLHIDVELGAQPLDLGTITARGEMPTFSLRSASDDLGVQLMVAVAPPTDADVTELTRDPRAAMRGGSDPRAALWIVNVVPDSPAARAGLRRGDRVVRVGVSTVGSGEAAVASLDSLTSRWRSKGRAVPWTVMRDGQPRTLDVLVLAEP